ncbi:unnamed protein product, partial [Ilex paraguariensis]
KGCVLAKVEGYDFLTIASHSMVLINSLVIKEAIRGIEVIQGAILSYAQTIPEVQFQYVSRAANATIANRAILPVNWVVSIALELTEICRKEVRQGIG